MTQPAFIWDPVDMPAFYARADAHAGEQLERPELEQVLCSADALEALPALVKRFAPAQPAQVLIVQDATPMQRGDADLKAYTQALLDRAGCSVAVRTVQGQLSTTQAIIDEVARLIEPSHVIIALGSGCITDIVKHACFQVDQTRRTPIPLIAVQTANSVCAFTSRMAVLTVNGVKRTQPSRLANALILDTQILRDAPAHFRSGGLGDVAVGAVTFADLWLGDALDMGAWNQVAYDACEDVRSILLEGHPVLADDGLDGQAAAGKLLTIAGLALTLSGESAPLSGYEHVTSHMLDMAAKANGRRVANHGHQCALATLLSLLLYQHVIAALDQGTITAHVPSDDAMRARIDAAFGAIDPTGAAAQESARDYMQKLSRWRERQDVFADFLEAWPTQRALLTQHLMPVEDYAALLRQMGHPMDFSDMQTPVSRREVRWAFYNAHLMRKRFSIGDLAFFSGLFDETLRDTIFDQFDTLTQQGVAV